MSESILNYDLKNGVAVLHMDDGKANALGHDMIAALSEALDRAETEANAVVLIGREKRFCAGFDLSVMSSGPEAVNKLVSSGAHLMTRLYTYKLPIIAACTGHALAAGGLLLLASDYRVGTKGDFRIGLNEVSIGMTTPQFLIDFARDRVPTRLLAQAVIHARLFSPDEAIEAGFLDDAVAGDALETSALAVAERLGALPQPAFGNSKKKVNADTVAHINATLDADSSTFDGAS
ncbi:crotonase/enoyl-CoA hydratase family protein [Parvibaculaceae bacterium PLY_AMNH_Bact1]|nr:crotonase/enoyl-CoA hydratase family protein [Parvibaculaceae bacterium PLY_AMNH_Bact1]